MTAQTTKMGPSPVSATTPPENTSTMLERSDPSVRPSTPDYEALALSDGEEDHPQIPSSSIATPSPKPARRPSWLNKVPTNIPPKTSWATASHLSTGNSFPTGPAIDQSGWPTNTGPTLSSSVHWPHVGGGSLTWGTETWNTESRKDSLRLSEMGSSSALSKPSTVSNHFKDDSTSPTTRTTSGEWAVPFSIPLHPTPKACRSQSYSVGQLDPEYFALMARKSGTPYAANLPRNSGCQFSALQHRSLRPSFLGDLSHDLATFGRLPGDVVDCRSPDGSESGMNYYTTNQARTIERLSRENALLRQSAGQMEGGIRDRTMSTAAAASGYAIGAGADVHNWHRIRDSVPEEADLAVDDLDEVTDNWRYANIHRHTKGLLSEHSIHPRNQYPNISAQDSWGLQNFRKVHWQTSPGFGSMAGIENRRHSFADTPIRQLWTSGDSQATAAVRAGPPDRNELNASVGEGPLSNIPGQNQSSFVCDQALRAPDGPSAVPTSVHQAYATPNASGRHGLGHSYQDRPLYIVTFKCHRADVFYIQENKGLQAKSGDLVIVEADRGTDLGTVQHARISMQRARELKQKYAEDHYMWLMMFSRQDQNGSASAMHPTGGMHARSVGMGLHGPHGVQVSAVDIKPKLIKRLAQNHEIRTLRDKESNEAKAKRVCQQKVAEHRLNMEILAAEFQMDWKKLTFYYFANSYINFNPLVTDIFKIYKTRVWMSAVNPRVVCQQYGEV